ncbi:hypothetical protein JCM3766R1_004930 [Sporobolomyces carnicolor]
MARKWSSKYAPLVDPWSICAGIKHLENAFKDVIVPESMVFTKCKPKTDKRHDGSPRLQIDRHLLPGFALSNFFFRNLTTFKITGDFRLPVPFLVGLFGPAGQNRSIIEHLKFDSECRFSLNAILFEALDRISWGADLDEDDFAILELIPDHGPDADVRDEFKQRENERSDFPEHWDQVFSIVEKHARSDHRFFDYLVTVSWPHDQTLTEILQTRHMPCCPFSSLVSLSFITEDGYDLYCVLYSRLFPVLRHLKLAGCLEFSATPESLNAVLHDVKLLRCSITARRGVILPPKIAESATALFPNAFDSWAPLERDSFRAAPAIKYFGPQLTELDLSEYEVGLL